MPKELLLKAMNVYWSRAAYYQPRDGNNHANEKKFESYLGLSVDAAAKAAPYYNSRLATTTLQTKPDGPGIQHTHKIEIEYVKAVRQEAGGS